MDIYYKGKIHQGCEKEMPDTKNWNAMSDWEHCLYTLPNYEVSGNHNFKDGQDVTGRYKLQHQFQFGQGWEDCGKPYYDGLKKDKRIVALASQPAAVEGEKKVTRIEVIDYTRKENCRAFTKHDIKHYEIQYQDEGRTMKIFINN